VHISLLQITGQEGLRSNKDTNGGYGTVNDFGQGLVARLLKAYKNLSMNFPELLPAYVNALVKQRGHTFSFDLNRVNPQAGIILIQTSIVYHNLERQWAKRLRREAPHARIGLIGSFASLNPGRFAGLGDFIIHGETEAALLQEDIAGMDGLVEAAPLENLDDLPFPDWSHILAWRRGYGRVTGKQGHLLPMSTSRGCPMSCGYYCTYPLAQGRKLRVRSPECVVDEIASLQDRFDMHTVMFRDPIFSLKIGRVAEICELILKRGLHFNWICETHPNYLPLDLIQLMARAGCVSVKLGIESGDLDVMQKSKRAQADLQLQETVIRNCEKHGIRVLAFYILGFMHDTPATVLSTIDYACRLNTYGAQFSIATPYPGTAWYQELQQAGRYDLDDDLQHYNQYRLVFRHPNLSFDELESLKSLAYRRYYLNPRFIARHILHLGPK
jgi:anaerobic magnesium-protoporphyrin IX monomethyl ester cyclase